MSAKVTLTDSDLKAGYLIKAPAWVSYRVKGTNVKPSEDKQSTNYFLVVVGIAGEMIDVEVVKLYNSKLIKLANRFFMAVRNESEGLTSKDLDFDDYKDVIVEGYTQRGEDYKGNPINDISDWRTPKAV